MKTVEDYLETPEGSYAFQLINGEIIESPSPGTNHQLVLGNILRLLHDHVIKEKMQGTLIHLLGVFLSNTDVVIPDILFFGPQTMHFISERGAEGAPDFVIEIFSPYQNTRIDLVDKKALYTQYGVKELWYVDYQDQVIDIYHLQTKSRARNYGRTDVMQSGFFPKLKFYVREAFEDMV